MKTVLIAGATGYLGRYTVQAFKHAGYTVRVLVRSEKKLSQQGAALAPAVADCVDEVHLGDVTKPETLRGIADGVDVVFSSISLMGAKSKLTWHDVDYQGNINLLHEAQQANVEKFVFISAYNAEKLPQVPILKAHEDFAVALANSGLPYTVIRPTGYFSDMGTFFEMAQSGRVYLLGNGSQRINPIHGADLAQVSVDAVTSAETDINVGGPEVLTWNQVAEIALDTVGKPRRITRIPLGLAHTAVNIMRPFSWKTAELVNFFVSSAEMDNAAPTTGTHTLAKHYAALKVAGDNAMRH